MARSNSVARTVHHLGLAAWFGGSLMGAVGVNGAAAQVDDTSQRARVANAGWSRWTPVNLVAIAGYLWASLVITKGNKGRLVAQKGVGRASLVKTGLTAGALGATACARVLGQKVISAGDVPVEGGTTPASETPPDVAAAQRKLDALQWVVPALTGALLVMDARMGEQQRPAQVAAGVARRILPDSLVA